MVFARLRHALRRQDWAAVALEIVIVVVGIVIGFQITVWGQGRADASKERSYLRQLAADLRETEAAIERADSLSAVSDATFVRVIRAYHMATPPPQDSLFGWVTQGIFRPRSPKPVLGTAQALVSSGDLTLVRNDVLRSEITAYLEESQSLLDQYEIYTTFFSEAAIIFSDRIGMTNLMEVTMPVALRDSAARADPTFWLPEAQTRSPFPVTAEELLSDRDAFNAAVNIANAQGHVGGIRGLVREEAVSLRALVEAELDG